MFDLLLSQGGDSVGVGQSEVVLFVVIGVHPSVLVSLSILLQLQIGTSRDEGSHHLTVYLAVLLLNAIDEVELMLLLLMVIVDDDLG